MAVRTSRRTRSVVAAVGVSLLLTSGLTACAEDGGDGVRDESASTTEADEPTAEELFEQGLAAQADGRLDEARELYLRVIDADPTNKFAYYDLGVIYQELDATDDARDAYDRALRIDADYAPALFNLAVLETVADGDRAVTLYRRLLELDPDDANVHLNLGLLLRDRGDDVGASAELEAAVRLDPTLAARIEEQNGATSTTSSTGG